MRKTYAPEAYGEVVWFGRRGAGAKRAIRSAGDGGKRAVLREEHEVSCKAIAQGRPECFRCPVCSCAFLYAQIARETAGAASTRSSLRPLISGGQGQKQTPGDQRREIAKSHPRRMGRAKRNPSPTNTGVDGFRFALPKSTEPISDRTDKPRRTGSPAFAGGGRTHTTARRHSLTRVSSARPARKN